MRAEAARLLLALQHGDTAFPGGQFAFSWGLEGLAADGKLRGEAALSDTAMEQLHRRWASFDRVALRRAHADPAAACDVDAEVECMTLVATARAGSRQAGRSLLGVHARLGTGGAADLRARVAAGTTPGHLCVVQGVVGRGLGLDMATTETLAAWSLISGLASAAVRLGLIGRLAAQALLTRLGTQAADILADPPPARMHAFTPLTDIAMARHAARDLRLFAT